MRSARLTVLALLAAVGLPGCSAAGSRAENRDGGSGSDMGASGNGDLASFPGADLGLPSDGAVGFSVSIVLRVPPPLASAIATSQDLDFDVQLNDASQSDVESWLDIAPRTTMTAITGGFLWTASGPPGAYALHFIPSAPLTDQTDYAVHAVDSHTHVTAIATGFSTGSRPRVSGATLTSQSGGALVAIDLVFSEPMNASTIAGAVSVSSGGVPIPGTVIATSPGNQNFHFAFTNGASGIGGAVTLDVSPAALSATGAALLPDDWDSPTAAGGDAGAPFFEYTFPNVPLTATTSTPFIPTVD